jgi:pimeloyl-ACP methyl ester carboxylesterase
MGSLVTIRGLHKASQMGDETVHALDGVDLEFDRGEYIAILGPSGSGKSTLMHILGFMDQPTIGAMAEDILARSPSRFSLAGHSMGGRVALEIVARAPDRVERLALLDTGFHPAKAGESDSRNRLIRIALDQGMAALARRWLPPMVAADRVGDTALMARLSAMVERADPPLFQRQIGALLTRPNARRTLSAITCPTAVIVGKLDSWSPPAQHEEMAACIQNSYLAVIEGSGHMTPAEQPEAVADVLAEWMTTAPGRGRLTAAS